MPYPDNFNRAAFESAWGRDEPVDTRDEDDVIESRQEAKEHYSKIDVTKDMSPFGAALFKCFGSSDRAEQIAALGALENKLIQGKGE